MRVNDLFGAVSLHVADPAVRARMHALTRKILTERRALKLPNDVNRMLRRRHEVTSHLTRGAGCCNEEEVLDYFSRIDEMSDPNALTTTTTSTTRAAGEAADNTSSATADESNNTDDETYVPGQSSGTETETETDADTYANGRDDDERITLNTTKKKSWNWKATTVSVLRSHRNALLSLAVSFASAAVCVTTVWRIAHSGAV